MTHHPADDRWAAFSPDGRQLAYQSDSTGEAQLFVMPAKGGVPRQITSHTEGFTPMEWFPDGTGILATAMRRLRRADREAHVQVDVEPDPAKSNCWSMPMAITVPYPPMAPGCCSPATAVELYRKGYQGSKASQLWMYTFDDRDLQQPVADIGGCRSPMWRPDGRGFYYVRARDGCFNLWEHDLDSGAGSVHTPPTPTTR